jgi:pimeloyl-ACP methyl ester carboxylesterase
MSMTIVATVLLAVVAGWAGGLAGPAGAAEALWQQLPAPAPMPEAKRSGYAPVDDFRMYYAVYGAGEPVILLHGGLGNADYWGNQVPALAEHYRVIVADSRGHGRSTRTDQPYSYQLMASDVLALMDYLQIDKAAIVGWSDGGIIGLDLAINHPERLTKLFAFGANYKVAGLRDDIDSNPTFNAYIERAGHDYRRLSKTPDQYDAFVEQISGMWSSQPDYTPAQLGKITLPTVIADGAHDEAIRQEHTKELAELIPDAKLLILPDVSHFAMWQNPAEFNQAVLDFLETP